MSYTTENLPSSGLFVFALIWTIAFLLLRSVRWRRAQAASPPARRKGATAAVSASAAVTDPPEAVRQWEVRFHELARDLSAQIDTKLGLLDQLLRATEAERERLERLVAEARQLGLSPPASGSGAAGRGAGDPRWGERRGGAGSHLSGPATGSEPGSAGPERRRQIYQLADDGFDPLVISHRTGVPLGEVELMLSLRPRRAPQAEDRAA